MKFSSVSPGSTHRQIFYENHASLPINPIGFVPLHLMTMGLMAFFCHFAASWAHFTCLSPEASPSGQCCTPGCANRFLLGLGLCRSYATANYPLSVPVHQRCARSANGSWTWSYCLPVLLASRDDCGSPCVGCVRENRPAQAAPADPPIDRPNPPIRPCWCCQQGVARKHCCRARPHRVHPKFMANKQPLA